MPKTSQASFEQPTTVVCWDMDAKGDLAWRAYGALRARTLACGLVAPDWQAIYCMNLGCVVLARGGVERSNLSTRMSVHRFTRLTNAFSKKWENHWTPAMAAGIADHDVWSVRELLEA